MENFIKQLRENWVILLFMGSVVMSWTMFSARLTQAELKIQELEILKEQIQKIQIDVAVIKERIINIDKKI